MLETWVALKLGRNHWRGILRGCWMHVFRSGCCAIFIFVIVIVTSTIKILWAFMFVWWTELIANREVSRRYPMLDPPERRVGEGRKGRTHILISMQRLAHIT